MSKTHLLHKLLLLFALVLAGEGTAWATTYKLTKVTSVSAGNKYVFERNNHVLSNTVSSKALQTTGTYSKTGLAGNESFVWTLETATNGFYMKNESLSSNKYLNNSSGTDMSFGSKSSVWKFEFPNGVALISNTSNSNRFIGETTDGSNVYKAYASGNLSSYGHDITVYVLEEINDIPVTGVELNKSILSITCGDTDNTLVATVYPIEATGNTVTWSSSNENVATVDENGIVSALAVGTATITVKTDDGDFTATCEVTVTPNTAKPSMVETVFEEYFSGVTGNSAASVVNFDNENWTLSGSVYGFNGNGIRLGKDGGSGSATTPVLTKLKNTATIAFKAQGWSDTEKTISIIGTNCTVTPTSFTDLPSSSFSEKEVTISEIGDNPQITFSAAGKPRVIIDDIVITQQRTAVDVKLSSTGYASYCSTFALDLTPTADYAAWVVKSTSGTAVEFAKITGKVPANTPFILYNPAKSGETVSLPIIEDDDEGIAAVSGNMLHGTLSPTYVTTVEGDYTNFGLSGGSFVKINDGTIPANKAYLPILTSNVPSGARLAIVFDDEITGISTIEHTPLTINDAVYDMQGRRVSVGAGPVPARKGLYIVNGKKVAIK